MQKQCAPSLIRSASLSKTHCTSSSATEAQMHADHMLAAVHIHRERLYVFFYQNFTVSITPRNQRVICTTKNSSAKETRARNYIHNFCCTFPFSAFLFKFRRWVLVGFPVSRFLTRFHEQRRVWRPRFSRWFSRATGRPGHTELLRREALAETRHFWFGE